MHESIDSCRVGSAHHVTGGPFRVHLLLRGTNESHMQATCTGHVGLGKSLGKVFALYGTVRRCG